MTARQNSVIALDRAEFARIGHRAVLAAILWGILSALWTQHIITWAVSPKITDPRMETGCRWPTQEGEATLVLVRHGKVDCYLWR